MDRDSVSLKVGERVKLIPTFYPENATIDKIDWKSTDYDIATVIGGNVVALKEGTATIVVMVRSSGRAATCVVNVGDSENTDNSLTITFSNGDGISTTIDNNEFPYTVNLAVTIKAEGKIETTTVNRYDDASINNIVSNKLTTDVVGDRGKTDFSWIISDMIIDNSKEVRYEVTILDKAGKTAKKSFIFKMNSSTTVYDPEMVSVTGGTFTMGCTDGDDCNSWELPTHQVTLSSYKIGKYEVTQAQWEAVMGSNPSNFKGSNLPVETVSWNDIVGTSGNCTEINGIKYYADGFIYKLNQLTGKQYRLPTEAEWEYACRGGISSAHYKYSGSNNIDDVAWYVDNSSSTTHIVGTKQANELGIYDMSGNVWEWCSDWLDSYSSGSQTNPTGAVSGYTRVFRGGSWGELAQRVSCRGYNTPSYSVSLLGFRLALVP